MNQATYCCSGSFSTSDFYHYGLGLDKYTHFTSPIRRYADILVHRLLLAAVEEQNIAVKFDTLETEELCNHMNTKHKAAQDIEKDAQQLFLAFFFDDLATKGNDNPILVDAVIYSLRTNGVLIFVPKYGIKGALHLCNKDRKVAIVRENMEWTDGKLSHDSAGLVVEGLGLSQKYQIFDHLTVSIKVQKCRAHQHKIIFDLIKREPYLADWDSITVEEPQILLSQNDSDDEEMICENKHILKDKEFDLYLFLEKMKAMTLLSNDENVT